MRLIAATDANGTIWVGDGLSRRVVPSMGVFNNYVVLSKSNALQLVNVSGQPVSSTADLGGSAGGDTIEALGVRVG